MKSKSGLWGLLIMPPFIFLFCLIFCLIYAGANNLSEEQISLKITACVPVILFVSQLGMLILLWSYSRSSLHNILHQTFKSPQLGKDVFWGVLLGLAIAVSYFQLGIIDLIAYLGTNFGDYVPVGETSKSVGKNSLLFFTSNVILAPFVEENIYRNVAFRKLQKQYSSQATVLISALFFGLLHWLGGFWYIMVTGVIIGLPLGFIQLKKEGVLLVYTAHLTLNLFEFINSILI